MSGIAADLPVGAFVMVETTDAAKHSGEVFFSDASTLCLHETDRITGKSLVKVIMRSMIGSLELPSSALRPTSTSTSNGWAWKELSDDSLPLPPCPDPVSSARAIDVACASRRRLVGVGASFEAQSLFDAVSKVFECVWREKVIVVLDQVRIEPPYVPESVFSMTDDKALLNRVVRIVSGHRQRRLNSESRP